MFDPSESPRVFGLACGVDFPKALVAGLLERTAGQPPQAMGRITLYVNTTRMQRRIKSLLADQGAMVMPRLRLVTDLSQIFPAPDLPPAVPRLRRRLQLAVLVSRLLDSAPELAPRSAIADLAESLANLMAEMQGEGVSPQDVSDLDVSTHSELWARTQTFLNIIAPYFADLSEPDAEGRQRLLAQQIARRWALAPPSNPIIVAGSTGSRGATSLFMRAVASLPQGAVVLPGFDFDTPASVWNDLGDAMISEDHPQYRFRKLADMMGFDLTSVPQWHDTPPPSADRNRVISLALRPAPVTDQWMIEGPALPDLPKALADVTLVEARTPRQEALAIALMLKRAAAEGKTAALISPDRTLTRQVAAALDRWTIKPDDSAGLPLNLSAPGRLLRHLASLFGQRIGVEDLLTLLKHPLTASAMDRGQHLLFTRELELYLRQKGPAFPTRDTLTAWAVKRDWQGAQDWATAMADVMDAFAVEGAAPLRHHVERLERLAERLSRGAAPDGTGLLWTEASGREARSFLDRLLGEADHGGTMTAVEFRNMFENLLVGAQVRTPDRAHPGIMIWGTIEARVQGADLVILGGLNDGSWPSLPPPDPWLNRKMRQEAGLLLPERRIGLSAHDFQQAAGAPQVVFTRSLRNADAETVPSRWLNRLATLLSGLSGRGGPEAMAQMRQRGAEFLDQAALLDRPPANSAQPEPRPAPCPPIAARPKELSVTQIETLIRDPFAIYADKVLKLRALKPLRQQPEARDRGTLIHAVLETFVKTRPTEETREQARARLIDIARNRIETEVPWPASRLMWLARMERVAETFLSFDSRFGGDFVLVEGKGGLSLPDLDFTLVGVPDRIDRLPDGTLHLIDYKTGTPPTPKQQKSYAKQLLLGALIAEEGGFGQIGPQTVSSVTYVGFGGKGKLEGQDINEEVIAAVRKGLRHLIGSYMRREKGYASRRAVFTEAFPGDYDHLARFGEWEMTDTPRHALVGPDVGEPQ